LAYAESLKSRLSALGAGAAATDLRASASPYGHSRAFIGQNPQLGARRFLSRAHSSRLVQISARLIPYVTCFLDKEMDSKVFKMNYLL
jgi:hypothetical protein